MMVNACCNRVNIVNRYEKVNKLPPCLLSATTTTLQTMHGLHHTMNKKGHAEHASHVVEGDPANPYAAFRQVIMMCSAYMHTARGAYAGVCVVSNQPAKSSANTCYSSSGIRPPALLHCHKWHWVQCGSQLAAHT